MAQGHTRSEQGRLQPRPIEVGMSVSQLVDHAFLASTAGRLAAAADLLAGQVLRDPDAVIGLGLDASLAAGGVGISALAPLLQGGYIDWAAVGGSNIFYDALHSLGRPFLRSPVGAAGEVEDCGGGSFIRRADLQAAEHSLREILSGVDFQQRMGSAALHDRIGAQLRAREKSLGVAYPSFLTTAHETGVPVFNPSPIDNPFGSLIAHLGLMGNRLAIDPSGDLNEAAALVNAACARGSACAIWCLGHGPAADFLLSVPRHLHTLLGADRTPAYAVRIRMAGRAHPLPMNPLEESTSATPGSEPAPEKHERTPIDFALSTDLSVALPILTAYILDRVPPRPLKRLGHQREAMMDRLRQDLAQSALRRAL
ncbi:MAG: deoxyhypusine synthase family protein [Candidatus Eisenbacteria bacterium]